MAAPDEDGVQLLTPLIPGSNATIRVTEAELAAAISKIIAYETGGFAGYRFTNGTLVNRAILDLFAELPPHAVEISLYGATAPTHEDITGLKGSFNRSLRATEQLIERGIRLRLKSVLMRPNLKEFPRIHALAEETYGVDFRMDASIVPRLSGDRDPLELRVPASVAVEQELANPDACRRWAKTMRAGKNLPPSPKLYSCGVGVIGLHIDAEARLLPCLITTDVAIDLTTRSFADAWSEVVEAMASNRPLWNWSARPVGTGPWVDGILA